MSGPPPPYPGGPMPGAPPPDPAYPGGPPPSFNPGYPGADPAYPPSDKMYPPPDQGYQPGPPGYGPPPGAPMQPGYGQPGPPGYGPPPPGYGPPGPGGYGPPPGPSPGHPGGYPSQMQGTTTVVVGQPSTVINIQSFREAPTSTSCPHCHAQIVTSTEYESGTFTYLICAAICLLGCDFGCCLIPFCVDSCKDVVHHCPNCKQQVSRWSRL